MKLLYIKTLIFSGLFLITFMGIKLHAERYYQQSYNPYEYQAEEQVVYEPENEPYYENRYQRRVYRNAQDRPFVGAGVGSEGIGVNVGRIGVGIGNY